MAIPYLPLGISAAVLGGILLFGREEDTEVRPVTTGPAGPGGPGGPGGGTGPGAGRLVVAFPAAAPRSRVAVAGFNTLAIRSPAPSTNDAVSRVIYRILNGEEVAVLETDIREQGASVDAPNRWWHVISRYGDRGYARAIGPRGEANFSPLVNVPGAAIPMAGIPRDAIGQCGPWGGYGYGYPGYGYGYPYAGFGYPGWGPWGFGPGFGLGGGMDIVGQFRQFRRPYRSATPRAYVRGPGGPAYIPGMGWVDIKG
jgi:hypothetical protein